jgi:hypothetical protein
MVELPPHLVSTGIGLQIYGTQATRRAGTKPQQEDSCSQNGRRNGKRKKKDRGQSPAARVRKPKTAGQGSRPHDLSGNGLGHSVGDAELDEPDGLRWKRVEKISEGHSTEAAAKNEKHSLAHV